MDSLVLQSMDELYDMEQDLIYTCDYGMMTKGSKACPVQGGFIVLKPSMDLFQQLVDVVLEGDYRCVSTWLSVTHHVNALRVWCVVVPRGCALMHATPHRRQGRGRVGRREHWVVLGGYDHPR
jgi:hypothetical protein